MDAKITVESLGDSHWSVVRAISNEKIIMEAVSQTALVWRERAAMLGVLHRKGYCVE